MDEIIEFENSDGEIIKLKKIIKLQHKDTWQAFDEVNRKWLVVNEQRVIKYYNALFVDVRKVLVEKTKKY